MLFIYKVIRVWKCFNYLFVINLILVQNLLFLLFMVLINEIFKKNLRYCVLFCVYWVKLFLEIFVLGLDIDSLEIEVKFVQDQLGFKVGLKLDS